MNKMFCSIEGCVKAACKIGLCNAHYLKKRRYGDPLISRQRSNGVTSRMIIKEGHALVELTQGYWAVIDLDDVERVGRFAWHYADGYARAHRLNLYLHQFLIGKAPPGYETDHDNRNKLDCRKSNINHVTYAQNNRNTDKNDTSSWCTYDLVRKKWKAVFKWDGRVIYSGYFVKREDATRASQDARLRLQMQEVKEC